MKKKFYLGLFLIFIITSIFLYADSMNNTNPYKGKYSLQSADDNTLELNNNNTFTLYIDHGKNTNSISGKYSVDDSNNIKLIYNDNNSFLTQNITNGKVEGDMITFYDENNHKDIFKK